MISFANFEPVELDLPDKFTSFRDSQIEAVERVLNSNKRFQALALPTGSGKTLIAMTIARALGVRTAILTSTLGLQEQYLSDFAQSGLVDIRGKGNYSCSLKTFGRDYNCRTGKLEGCGKKVGCTYEIERMIAKRASVVITNYAYWIRIHNRVNGLDLTPEEGKEKYPYPFELLILDEAHRAMEELSKALQVVVLESHLLDLGLRTNLSADPGEWSKFAADHLESLEENFKEYWQLYQEEKKEKWRKKVYAAEHLLQAFDQLAGIRGEDWIGILEPGTNYGRKWTLDPIWPGNWAYKLFRNVPKALLMSATLRPLAMKMLNLGKEEYDFEEWPRVFPAQNTPIYHLKTVRLNHRATQEDIDLWVRKIDEIIAGRLDRKGLIHTVSYKRQEYLLSHSRFRSRMIANTQDPDSPDAIETVERFKKSADPLILVSPSFSTGWDFPGVDCEFQIIAKLPFADTRNPLMKARLERHPLYVNYLTMQDLVQSCGRGTRSYSDKCEVFIVDDSIGWFLYHNKSLAPRWFHVIPMTTIPDPPQKLVA